MIGINLAQLTAPNTTAGSTLWKVEFPSLKIVSYCTGATKLANAWLFQLLSSFNPAYGTGSKFRLLVAAPLIREMNTAAVSSAIASEINALEERFKALQERSGQNTPLNELLQTAEILNIDVVGTSATVRCRLVSQANTPVYIEV